LRKFFSNFYFRSLGGLPINVTGDRIFVSLPPISPPTLLKTLQVLLALSVKDSGLKVLPLAPLPPEDLVGSHLAGDGELLVKELALLLPDGLDSIELNVLLVDEVTSIHGLGKGLFEVVVDLVKRLNVILLDLPPRPSLLELEPPRPRAQAILVPHEATKLARGT